VLVLASYVLGPSPMTLHFMPGVVVMIMLATITAYLASNGGRSAWFLGVLTLGVYFTFALTIYLLPPR
jgi:Ca2+:H+ antiporter